MKFHRLAPVAVALATLPACNMIFPYAPDQVFETQVRAECHFVFSCCTAGEADVLVAGPTGVAFSDLRRFRDEGACVQERLEEGSLSNEILRAINQAESAGRFTYDANTARTCGEPLINALNNCDADFVLGDSRPLETSAECSVEGPEGGDGTAGIPGTGKVKNDQQCFYDFECAVENSRCLGANAYDEPDTCATDDDCGGSEICDGGYCVPEPDAIVITDAKICVPPLLEGDDCSPNPDTPFLPSFCEVGTRCMPDKDGDLSCELIRIEGENCFGGENDCDRGLYCDTTGDEPECAVLKGEGDDCDASLECEVGLTCDFTRNNPSCEAPLPVDVEICNGIQGGEDPVYASAAQ
jgi:hypothetical protein